MNILISGATGFIGSYLTNNLCPHYNIFALYHRTVNKVQQNTNITYISTDEIFETTKKFDVVLMCHAYIGENIQSLIEVNVIFTRKLILKFNNSYLIYLSSISVYGKCSFVNKTSIASPLTPYGLSKLWGEKEIQKSSNYAIIRLSSDFGNSMKETTIIPKYINQALKFGKIEVWGNGSRIQNYIHLSDILKMSIHLIKKRSNDFYLGVTTNQITNIDLAKIISKNLKADIFFIKDDFTPSFEVEKSVFKDEFYNFNFSNFELEIKKYIIWKTKQFS